MSRGFFAVGIERHKTGQNLGSLWRSAHLYGAAFIFTVGVRYEPRRDVGLGDVSKAYRSIPLQHFHTAHSLKESLPYDCPLVGVEMLDIATSIHEFKHPERACYVLGSEDNGLTSDMVNACHRFIVLPGVRSMNVACAGTVVMHDRWHKQRLP